MINTIKWIPVNIKPAQETPFGLYLIWYRGKFGLVKDGYMAIGQYTKDTEAWRFIGNLINSDDVPVYWSEINPPTDTTSEFDSKFDFNPISMGHIKIWCKECKNSIDLLYQEFDDATYDENNIIHKHGCSIS